MLTNITQYFFDAARRFPDKIAIWDNARAISYSELAEQVERTAHYYQKKGIKPGDRVFVFIPMSIELYRVVLALFAIGATAVFVDEWAGKKRLDHCCEIANCRALITSTKFRIASWFLSSLRKIPTFLHETAMDKDRIVLPVAIEPHHPALITFTTGSTGIPKAAIRSHTLLNAQFQALHYETKPLESDICLTTLPIVLLINLGVGCTSIIGSFSHKKPHLMNSTKMLELIRDQKVNRLIASPFFIEKIALKELDLEHTTHILTQIFTGGAPIFPSDAALFKKAFPTASIQMVYGSTEAEPISLISVDELIVNANIGKGLHVGKVGPFTHIKIIQITPEPIVCNDALSLEKIELSSGKVGEIIVSGPHVLRHYLGNPEAEKQNKIIFEKSYWHRTGDSGFLDDQGCLYLTGRCESLSYLDGDLISPFLYEQELKEFKGVNKGTVMAINDDLTAVIEAISKDDHSQISTSIKSKLPKIKEVIFLNKIPRDPRHFSKIDYTQLRRILRTKR